MTTRFAIALLKPGDDPFARPTLVPLADYLAEHRAGGSAWQPNLETSALLLESGGREWLASIRLTTGHVDRLAAQFLPARDRLARGERAVIRFATYDEVGEYLLVEPEGDAVAVSKVDITDDPPMFDFPMPQFVESYGRIYDYVREKRANLAVEVGPVSVPRAELLAALEREARAADDLFRELGVAPNPPILPR